MGGRGSTLPGPGSADDRELVLRVLPFVASPACPLMMVSCVFAKREMGASQRWRRRPG